MKKVLIVYTQMMVGGSTTSLLSLLNELPADKYDVDLLLLYGGGMYMNEIPPNVHVLPFATGTNLGLNLKLKKLFSPRYLWLRLRARQISRKYGNSKAGEQWASSKFALKYKVPDKLYDVAVGFLEGAPNRIVARFVKAKRKIAWFHIDYKASGYFPEFDHSTMDEMDSIVTVSEKCKDSFCEMFPNYAKKCVVVENILSQKRLDNLALADCELEPQLNCVNLITVCRITFDSKALDRAVQVISRLKSDGYLPNNRHPLHWYIIGDGPDRPELERLIAEAGLGSYISLLGMQKNPYPYLAKMTMFFLPSRREGKPMSVTEAFMLGLPVLATEYSSAREQIRDGIDGIIVANSEEGIYEGLKRVILQPEIIPVLKANVDATDYSNTEEIQAVQALFDGTDE